VLEAYRQSDLDGRLQLLQKSQQVYRDADSDGLFAARATQDQIRLLLQQRAFQASHVEFAGWVGLSVTDTIYQLLLLGKERAATKMRDTFRVPDRRFWHTKVRALADSEDWGELFKFSKSKRSPIGYRVGSPLCECECVLCLHTRV
jgi:vacuolar protein sorting-associated protein 16